MIEGDVLNQQVEYQIQRCIVYLDLENLQISYNQIYGKPLDLKKLDHWLNSNYNIIEKIAYLDVARANGTRIELRRLGWTIKDVETKKQGETNKTTLIKNALDSQLIANSLAYSFRHPKDKIILMSGDGDYVYLAVEWKQENVSFDVIGVDGTVSTGLKNFADNYYPIDGILKVPKKKRKKEKGIVTIDDKTTIEIRNKILDEIKKAGGKISGPEGLEIIYRHTSANNLKELGVTSTKAFVQKYPLIFGGIKIKSNIWLLAD